MPASVWPAAIACLAALVTAFFGYRGSQRAGRVAEAGQQLSWVQQAQNEAAAAKAEARQAKQDAGHAEVSAKNAEQMAQSASRRADNAEHRADDAERRFREVIDALSSMVRWAESCITSAHDPDVSAARVRELVNGGPPGFTQVRMTLQRRSGTIDS